jgi:hypothetical protein
MGRLSHSARTANFDLPADEEAALGGSHAMTHNDVVEVAPRDRLKNDLRLTGILTLPPDQGGITELLCDADECFQPRGRDVFEPVPPPIPDWIPTEDHFPKTQEVGGKRLPGNVRLTHRLCNATDYAIRMGRQQEAERARGSKERWHHDHPEESVTSAGSAAAAEARWAAMRAASEVVNLDEVARLNSADAARLATGFWLHVWRIRTEGVVFACVGATRASDGADTPSLPFALVGETLQVRPGTTGASFGHLLQTANVDVIGCLREATIAIGPIRPVTPRVEAVETALAGHLCSRGYRVINDDRPSKPFDRGLFIRVCHLIDGDFPQRPIERVASGNLGSNEAR